MIRLALFTASMLLAADARINLPVTIKSTSSSCSSKFIEADLHPSLSWANDTTAVVRVTALFGYGTSAADDGAHAYLEGKKLILCYGLYIAPVSNNGSEPTCRFPEALEFTVSNLPRGEYETLVSMCTSGG
jgi:hypothetical protein